ncbi:MAG: hypothetical protein CMH27_08445 [Micavibrio sp.]|nr:hypothetical protein [Micavibrio sp.]|tara:strand:+ start:1368 stop:2678 length:1311 start_codon:yes stop_codon:yes gene_type:complete
MMRISKSMRNSKRSYIRSSSFVMAVLFTILCGGAALSLGYFINYFAKGHVVYSTNAILDAELKYIKARGLPDEGRDGEYLYIYLDKDQTGLPENMSEEDMRLSEGILVFKMNDGLRESYAGKTLPLDNGRRLLVAYNITNVAADFKFMQWLGIASICFVMLVVFISYLISVFVVKGTNRIAETAQDIIATGDLSRRLEVTNRWDDLSNMAAVLNTLLARIEELMQGVRQVSDNIAHDLRTPLTRMRNKIEALQKKHKDDNYDDLIEEADRLLSTFNALLRITRIETERQRGHFGAVDVKALLEDVIAFYAPLAEEKHIKIDHLLSEAIVHGDRDLLFQAFANMLDNAIKFTPEGGHVDIKLVRSGAHTIVSISDSGIGVSKSDADKIFERFYRAEQSRSTRGTGLGLSLVKAVINLHRGHIQIEPNMPGLKIVTTL